jgi:hypothetical protein
MSSTYAIDSAWDMLHSNDKVEKIAPLAIPILFGLHGAYVGAGGQYFDESGRFDPGIKREAVAQDPFTGGLVAEKDLGTSFGARATGAVTGLGQAANPFGIMGKVATKPLTTGAKSIRATKVAQPKGIRQRAANRLKDFQAGARDVPARAIQTTTATGGRIAQAVGQAEQSGALNALGALGAAYAGSKLPQAPTTGFGAQSQMGTAGAAPTQGTQVSGNADPYALREIYKPQAGSAFEGQKEFGGLGVQKGDNMFRKNIGEELLSEAAYVLHKAHCGTELKADCPKDCKGCPECDGDDKKKADDKKKPAHGMVIVIGSKAGPGPSKDGKKEKLDSEKKKE